MGITGILAVAATLNFLPLYLVAPSEGGGGGARLESGDAFRGPTPLEQRLGLLQGAEIERGELLAMETPVGKVEVLLLSAVAQHEMGEFECPLNEAVVAFAPAGAFSRKERPSGRVVLSLPVARF